MSNPAPIETTNVQEEPHVSPLKSPLSSEEKSKLEKQINGRPEKQDLVDRNILKGGTVAPALQAARDKLQRSQLEDKLDSELQSRPKPEELVKRGILNEREAPTT